MRLRHGVIWPRVTQGMALERIVGWNVARIMEAATADDLRWSELRDTHRDVFVPTGKKWELHEIPCGLGKTLIMIILACFYRVDLTIVLVDNEFLAEQFLSSIQHVTTEENRRVVNLSLVSSTQSIARTIVHHLIHPNVFMIATRQRFVMNAPTRGGDCVDMMDAIASSPLIKTLIMIDECHHLPTSTFDLRRNPLFKKSIVFLFTGLFHKESYDELAEFYDKLVEKRTVVTAREAVDAGDIMEVRHRVTGVHVDPNSRIPTDEQVVHAILAQMVVAGINLIFCDSVDQCKVIKEIVGFTKYAVCVPQVVDGSTSHGHRAAIARSAETLLVDNSKVVVVLCRAGDTGIDIPEARRGFVLSSNHGSLAQAAQRAGRLCRVTASKRDKQIDIIYIVPLDKHKNVLPEFQQQKWEFDNLRTRIVLAETVPCFKQL